jgi:predicted mannosyl-3-phosphoglycerate phosphatase (HAD superfamily)
MLLRSGVTANNAHAITALRTLLRRKSAAFASAAVANFELKKCKECLKQQLNVKCHSTTLDYSFKYRFTDVMDNCRIKCTNLANIILAFLGLGP